MSDDKRVAHNLLHTLESGTAICSVRPLLDSISMDEEGHTVLWELGTGRRLAETHQLDEPRIGDSLSVLASGHAAVYATNDGSAVSFDLQTLQVVRRHSFWIPNGRYDLASLYLTPVLGGTSIVAASTYVAHGLHAYVSFRIWDIERDRLSPTTDVGYPPYTGSQEGFYGLCSAIDDQHVITVESTWPENIPCIRTRDPLNDFRACSSFNLNKRGDSLVVHPYKEMIAVGAGPVQVIDLGSGMTRKEISGGVCEFLPDGQNVLIEDSSRLAIYDIESGHLSSTLMGRPAPAGKTYSLSATHDGRYIIAGGETARGGRGAIWVWEPAN